MAEVDENDTIPFNTKKRTWTPELDVYLLREVTVHEPHLKRYGRVGETYEELAKSLNSSGKLPWRTDRRHAQGRLTHLMSWRKTQASEPAACEDVNGEQREAYDERLQLLDDIFETAERFKEEEADQRKCVKEKEDALEAAGKRVRQQAMQRQNSCSEDAAGTLSAENDEPEDVDSI
jgi:hypothetical protein